MNTQETNTSDELIRTVLVLSVTKVVTQRFPVAVDVPAAVAAGGAEALVEYIATHDDVRLDELPIEESTGAFMNVSERDADDSTLVPDVEHV
ncbi:hypothetical protein [Streptomyces lasiicapitis]|uniref:hypothetical protein n=1 Tax=Streptomyces lasiicapitis TaxID=1923961 RepID=UPI00364FC3E3